MTFLPLGRPTFTPQPHTTRVGLKVVVKAPQSLLFFFFFFFFWALLPSGVPCIYLFGGFFYSFTLNKDVIVGNYCYKEGMQGHWNQGLSENFMIGNLKLWNHFCLTFRI